MNFLILKKIPETKCYYTVKNQSSEVFYLLYEFFDDFKNSFSYIKNILNDPNETGTIGNCSAVDKKNNGIVEISCINVNDPMHFDIKSNDLLKVLELYIEAKKTCPQEIIVRFDENMENPVVEVVD